MRSTLGLFVTVAIALIAGTALSRVLADPSQAAYQQGHANRVYWEQWMSQHSGDAHDGASFWAGQRNAPHPVPCMSMKNVSATWLQSCEAAQKFLGVVDARRKSEAQYWFGWNAPIDAAPQTQDPASQTLQTLQTQNQVLNRALESTQETDNPAVSQPSGSPPMPTIGADGLPNVSENELYSQYRDVLMKLGYAPVYKQMHRVMDVDGRPNLVDRFPEVISCAPTGVAPCVFGWKTPSGASLLVTTGGELDDPGVTGRSIQVSGTPAPEPQPTPPTPIPPPPTPEPAPSPPPVASDQDSDNKPAPDQSATSQPSLDQRPPSPPAPAGQSDAGASSADQPQETDEQAQQDCGALRSIPVPFFSQCISAHEDTDDDSGDPDRSLRKAQVGIVTLALMLQHGFQATKSFKNHRCTIHFYTAGSLEDAKMAKSAMACSFRPDLMLHCLAQHSGEADSLKDCAAHAFISTEGDAEIDTPN